ncbi:MAG TPA: hypothetical protein PKY87_17850 [Terricaulis sp.]|nr:hypothetical protein [Terricaulis sp.]
MSSKLLGALLVIAGGIAVSGCGLRASPVRGPEGEVDARRIADERGADPVVADQTPPRGARAEVGRVVHAGAGLISYSGSRTPPDILETHLAEVAKLGRDHERAIYASQFDHWHSLDLNGDGEDERLVFLTIEGIGASNNYSRFLIVYRYVAPTWFASDVLSVGGKGEYSLIGDEIHSQNSVLTADATFYGEGDGMCCPTQDGQIHFRMAGGRLGIVTQE